MEGICTKRSLSPSAPTSFPSNTKWPKLDPTAAVCEDPLLLKGLCQPCTRAMAGQPSGHVKAALPFSEAPCPVASLWPFSQRCTDCLEPSWINDSAKPYSNSSEFVYPPGSKLFLSLSNLFLVFLWPSLRPNKNIDNLQHIYPYSVSR